MGKTSYEIGESLCKSMAIIAQKAVNEIQCDKTIICTIVDNSKKDLGYYTVSDGNVKFTASSDSKYTYQVDDQVQVTIPQGDYSRQKVIIGKYTADDENIPVAYVSPLETVITMTDNILPPVTGSLIANGSTPSIVLFEGTLNNSDKVEISNNQNYTSLALSAKFKCLLGTKKMQTGNYGLRLTINYTHADNPNYSDIYNDSLIFKDMLGNPYDFPFYLKQEKKINIVNLGQITGLTITFFQDNNFTEFDGEHIVKLEPDTAPNIFVSDVVISFGNDLLLIPDNKFEIYSNNPPTYSQTKALNDIGYGQKTIYSIWYNKDENNQFIGFTDGIPTIDDEGNHIPYDEDAYQKELGERMAGASVFIKEEDGSIPRITQALQIYGDSDTVNGLLQTLDDSLEREFENLLTGEQGLKMLVTIQKDTPEPDTNPLLTTIIDEIDTMISTTLPEAYLVIAQLGDLIPSDASLDVDPVGVLYKDILRKFGEAYNTLQENPKVDVSSYGTEADTIKTEINSLYKNFEDKWTVFLEKANYIFVDLVDTLYKDYSTMRPKLDVLLDDYEWVIQKWKKIVEKISNIKTNQNTRYDELRTRIIGPDRDLTLFDEEYEAFLEEYKNKYCIYWYRYESGYANEDDRYLQKDWKRLPNARRINGVATIPTSDQMTEGEPLDPLPGMPHRYTSDNSYLPRSSTPLPPIQMNYHLEAEKFQAVLIFNHEPYFSNELVFKNEDPVINTELTNAIYLELGPNAKDSYPYYDSDNKLSVAESNIVRQLRIRYNGVKEKDDALIGTWVYWYIPQYNSMLTYNYTLLAEKGFTYLDPENSARLSAHMTHLKPGYACYFKNIGSYTENDVTKVKEEDTYFYFGLYNQYASSRMNNTIMCRVVTSVNQFDTEKYFTFGNFGTAGTDFTLSLAPTSRQNALLNYLGDIYPLEMRAAFYDYHGQEITDETAPKISWGWMQGVPNAGLGIEDSLKGINYKEVSGVLPSEGNPENEGVLSFLDPQTCLYNILECSVKWNKITQNETDGSDNEVDEMTLKTYYPVPFGKRRCYMDGATTVIYNDLGTTPSYNKNPYKLFDLDTNEEIMGLQWSIVYYDKNGDIYAPKDENEKLGLSRLGRRTVPKAKSDDDDEETIEEFFLVPAAMYTSGSTIYPVVVCSEKSGSGLLWAQPILITQNRYGSTLLNNWDESLTIDEKNGTILSTMMGAGYKDEFNQFHGVLMGDVRTTAGSKTLTKTGLYGFHSGEQTFGLKVDGTAFFGKAGHGRIEIDGNDSTIKSSSFTASEGGWGMCIDLEDGVLEIKGQDTGNIILSDGSKKVGDEVIITPYLQIKSISDKVLFNIGPTKGEGAEVDLGYYMQTNDYQRSTLVVQTELDEETGETVVAGFTGKPGAGLHFDLEKGTLTGYDFTLKAEVPFEFDEDGELVADTKGGSYLQISSDINNLLQIYYTDNSRCFDIMKVGINDYRFKSFNYVNGMAGTEIDMNEGSIILYPSTPDGDGTNSQFIRLNGQAPVPTDDEGSVINTNYPLLIGSDVNPAFRVKWDGSFIVANGAFSVGADGAMKATSGTIGGWTITGSTLQSLSGNIILTASGDGGGSISTKGYNGSGGGYRLSEKFLTANNALFSNLQVSTLAVFGNQCKTYIDGQLGINVGGGISDSGGDPTPGTIDASVDLQTNGRCWFGGNIGINVKPDDTYGLKVDGKTLITGSTTIGKKGSSGDSLTIYGDIDIKGSLKINGEETVGNLAKGHTETKIEVDDIGLGKWVLTFSNGILTDATHYSIGGGNTKAE